MAGHEATATPAEAIRVTGGGPVIQQPLEGSDGVASRLVRRGE